MDVLGTKDHAEREDEEAERLVRPLPKKKPPRRDRRREQMRPDRDPDVEGDSDLKGDPDLSLNYKSVGGSVRLIARVLEKFAEESKLIPVRLRETGKVVNVSEDTLKENGSKYEKIEEGEGEKPKEDSGASLQKFVDDFTNPKSELAQRADKDPYKFLEELADPTTDVGQVAEANPTYDVRKLFKNIGLPPEIQTFSDVVQVLRDRIEEAKGKGKGKKPSKEPAKVPQQVKPVAPSEPAPKEETPSAEPPKPAPQGPPKADEAQPSDSPSPSKETPGKEPEQAPEAPAEPEAPKPEAPKEVEPPKAEGTPAPKAKKPAQPKPKEVPEPSPKEKDEAKEWVKEKRHEKDDFQAFGEALPTTKKSEEGLLFFDSKSKDHVPFEKLNPKDQAKLISSFNEGVQAKELDQKLDQLGPKEKQVISELADPKSAVSQSIAALKKEGHPLEGIPIEKVIPALKGVELPGVKNLPDLMGIASGVAKREAAKRPPAPPERKPASRAEMVKAMDKLLDALPPSEAGKFFNLHPIDAASLVRAYKEAKADGTKSPEELAKNYTTDPAQVDTLPKFGRFPVQDAEGKPKLNEEGKPLYTKKPYETLSDGEKAEAMQQHRMAALASSLVAKDHFAKEFVKAGLPSHVAPKIADASLSIGAAKPEEKERKARQVSKDIFTQAGAGFLGAPSEPDERFGSSPQETPPQLMNEAQKKRFLKSVEKLDPYTQMAAVAHLQGEDYHAAFKQFLDPKSSDAISEHDSASTIYRKMSNAAESIGRANRLYPSKVVRSLTNPADVFKGRVRNLLRKIDPAKEAELTKKFGKLEVEAYEKNLKKYEGEVAEHKTALEAYDRKRKVWEAAKAKHEGGGGYRDAPKNFDQPEPVPPPAPVPPLKPRGYEPKASEGPKAPDEKRPKSASIFSSYPPRRGQMGTSAPSIQDLEEAVKTALYHGVEPYPPGHEGFAPYTKWTQAHQRDLGPEDSNVILAGARDWLKKPMLSENIEGMTPDARFRAALDLSIRDTDSGKYSGAINPVLYNELLTKLSGTKTATTAEGTMKLDKDQANRTLTRLDRIAGSIQTNAEKWGMPFEAAKAIVNALDRTADEIEAASFGAESLAARQEKVVASAKPKAAHVIQQDSDESYMKTFNAPMAPHQTDSDESYMSQFKDDQSQAVETGKSTTGRPLAP